MGRLRLQVGRPLSEAAFGKFPGLEADLHAQLPRLQRLWDQRGSRLLRNVLASTGLPFAADVEVSCIVSLTEPSRGLPNNRLQLNLVSFLETSARGLGMERPLSDEEFVGLVFHEVLHKVVDNNFVQERSSVLRALPTAWLWGMQNPALLYAHLHTFALEQLAYTNLGLTAELAKVRRQDESFSPEYRRAWEIVTTGQAGPYLLEEMRALAKGCG